MPEDKKKLKIGILLRNRHDGPGGLEKVLEVLAKGIAKRDDAELFFYSLYPPRYTDFTKHFQNLEVLDPSIGIKRIASFLPAKLKRPLRKYYVKQHGHQLFDKMIADQIDVLITMDLSKQFLSNYPFLKRFKEKSGIPVLSWIHISLTGSPDATAKEAKEKSPIFDGHLAISQGLADELARDYQAKNIQLIYNPVDAAPLVKREVTRFVYVGRITKIKRVDSLLEQLAKLIGDWQLDIYGSTGDEVEDAKFKALIEALGLSKKVTFHGWQKDAWANVTEAGVLLLNSTREGFGLVIVEAMQRGIPVIASDCPVGPSELIQNDINGWLYDVNDEAKCRILLQEILAGTRSLPEPIVVKQSVSKFETETYLDNFLQSIQSYLKHS